MSEQQEFLIDREALSARNVDDSQYPGFGEHLIRSYNEYAIFVAEDRMIPSVVDGLKPVQRRLLWTAINSINMRPGQKTRKAARVIGDCLGKYHPHSDTAVYGALTNMTSDCISRNPFFFGQGNWGDPLFGDGAAAMRYTETVINELGYSLTQDNKYCNFAPNFDGEEVEPLFFVPPIPALLLMRSTGIAVGTASDLPDHNIGNVCDAVLTYMKNPNCRDSSLISAIQGPDRCMGGNILDYDENREELKRYYTEGRGTIYYSATWEEVESDMDEWSGCVSLNCLSPGGMTSISEDPDLWELIKSGEILLVDNSRGSQQVNFRIYYNNSALMANTILPMFSDFSESYNCVVMDYAEDENGELILDPINGKPEKVIKRVSLRYIISRWLHFRKRVVTARIEDELGRLSWEIEKLLVQLYLCTHPKEREKMFACSSIEEAHEFLMSKTVGFNERQAEYAPTIQLRTIMKLNEKALRSQIKALENKIVEQNDLLSDVDGVIRQEVKDFKLRFDDGRRTTIFEDSPYPEIDYVPYLVTANANGVASTFKSWPKGGKGLAQTVQAEFSKALITFVNEEGKAFQMQPFDVTAQVSAVGFATDDDEVIAVAGEDGGLRFRYIEELGRATLYYKGGALAACGLGAKDALLVIHADGSFQYFSPKNVAKLSKSSMGKALDLYWDEHIYPETLIRVGPDAYLVDGKGNELDIDFEDYETLNPAKKGVFVIDDSNLILNTNGRANVYSKETAFDNLDNLKISLPLHGEFEK